jgi:hypothetical protein
LRPRILVAAGYERRDTKDTSMKEIRLTVIGTLALVLAWYIGSAASASAMPAPPADGGGALPTPPPQPTVVHDHISAWTYVLIAGVAVVATLLIVALAGRVRRASSVRRARLQQPSVA